MDEYIVGLDIGSSNICAAVGKYDRYGELQIKGVTSVVSSSVKNGMIVDIDDTAECIKKCIVQLESMVDIKVSNIYISLSIKNSELIPSKGIVAVSSEDREITQKDVKRVKNAAKVMKVPSGKEIIDIIPNQYIIDGYDKIKDPVGMSGSRLELDACVILADSTLIDNLIKSIEKAGYCILGVVYQPIGDSKVVLRRDEREIGTALINVGGESIEISIHKDGNLVYTDYLDIGGNSITNDISICLKLPFNESENLKVKYGIVGHKNNSTKEEIKVNTGYNNIINIDYNILMEVIEARAEELLFLIQKKLKETRHYDEISSIVIIGGGLALIKGIQNIGESIFKIPFRIGTPQYVGAINPLYVSSIGVVKEILATTKNKNFQFENKEVAVTYEEENKQQYKSEQKGVLGKIKSFLTDFF